LPTARASRWRTAKVWRRLLARFRHSRRALREVCNENKVVYGGRACKSGSPDSVDAKQLAWNQRSRFANSVSFVTPGSSAGTFWAHMVKLARRRELLAKTPHIWTGTGSELIRNVQLSLAARDSVTTCISTVE
jgi:hypothetical protein